MNRIAKMLLAACLLGSAHIALSDSSLTEENSRLIEQMSPFFQLLARSDAAGLMEYVDSGNSIDERPQESVTAVLFAAAVSTPEILQILFEAGADIDQVAGRRSPLEEAVLFGRYENARKLMSLGADVSKRCLDQTSAIEYAVAARNFILAREIFTNGYDTNVGVLRNNIEWVRGVTPQGATERDRLLAMIDYWLIGNDDKKVPRHCN